ncbi:MAG TPA: hypothetical protein VLN49_24100, partial [Gemmatimonadaceae bacterium]|nr:hypothetical protein [Gemmatimonadaceae bacterium]
MGIDIVWTALAALAFVVLSHAAMAQQRETARWSRVRGESFIFARYATTGAGSLIAAARVGSGMLVGGVTGNRHEGPLTPILGLGTRMHFAHGATTGVILAAAREKQTTEARLYLMPKATFGALRVGAISLVSQRVNAGGSTRFTVNPLTMGLRVAPSLQVGGFTVADRRLRGPFRYGSGPSVHMRFAPIVLSIEALTWTSS